MAINYLSAEEIVSINGLLGCKGIINEGNLHFILDKIRDSNISIRKKAITLLYQLIISHPFIDCNKRTAFVSMQIFLNRNGMELEYSEANEYLLKMLLYEIADSYISYEETERILAKMII